MSSANAKWRQWKSNLYTKHIVPYENMPEMLYNPPPQSGILKEDWKDFVISRMSDGFRKISKEQKERRGKNIYPHHISRKGYAGLREEMKDKLTGDEEVDRALLWKQARADKKGEFKGDRLNQTIIKIDEYTRQKEEGVFKRSHPSEDILTQALETPEHSGRVRAIGSHVTPANYFNVTKGVGMRTDVQEIKMEFGRKMAEMDAKIMKLEAQLQNKDTEEKGSCSVKNHNVHYVEDVEEAFQDVVKEKKTKAKKQKSSKPNLKLNSKDVPKALKMLHSYSRLALVDGSSVTIPLDGNILGEEISLFIFFEDIHNIAELEAISGSCICIYMCHLYKECENENLLGRFRFANPYEVSHNPKTDSSKKADDLAKRLIGTSKNQFVLVPCNVGWHWILTVIDPHSETVYVLDSLYNKTHVEEWKSVVEMAMKVFNMSTHGKRTRQNMIWNVIKCPQQPDGKQCGFYVMRFMKDIIENCGSPASMSITLSFDEGYYSKKEIDEVRTEWAEFVHDFID